MADFDKIDKRDFDILVAKCGKSIGLKGEIRLIVYSDFSEIFTQGNVFLCKSDSAWDLRDSPLDSQDSRNLRNDLGESGAFFLTLKSFNPHKQSAFFDEIDSVDSAKNLTSMLLFSSAFLTQKYCVLGEKEHFWFEIVGMSVVDNGEIIGIVSDIERIGSVDYLLVATNPAILAKYPHIKAKKFYLPYIPRYILGIEKLKPEKIKPEKNANAIQNPPQTPKDSPKGTIFVRDSLGILEES